MKLTFDFSEYKILSIVKKNPTRYTRNIVIENIEPKKKYV